MVVWRDLKGSRRAEKGRGFLLSMGEGGHISTLDVGGAWVVRDNIWSTGS